MPPPSTGSTFRQRLGIYLLGVALGCLLLGTFWSARNKAAQQQQQQNAAATPPDSAPASTPSAAPNPSR